MNNVVTAIGAFSIATFVLVVYHDYRVASLERELDGMNHQFQRRIDALEEINRRESLGLTR